VTTFILCGIAATLGFGAFLVAIAFAGFTWMRARRWLQDRPRKQGLPLSRREARVLERCEANYATDDAQEPGWLR
jgi:hypothetical protein